MEMKKKLMLISAFLIAGIISGHAADDNYITVKGDPMQTRIYTLHNGLKVYLSVNKKKPRIQTYIAVNTGSRNDPHKTTGLAHYLEHLMFKGTTHFGTSNLEAERPLLDSIESRFEQYRYIVNPQQRKQWYHQIDSISQLAAKYNIPNEYDKMMASIGSEGSNAYTSNDQTCYQENIPSNEIDTWAKIQADRFQNMVIRGFHTELEAVYEEYNIGLANDGEKEWVALYKKLYPNHPYGTQTTIGTQEHLKNPSITNIKKYFHKYYVPNNIAIVMAGDFDPDKTINIIKKYFDDWKPSAHIDRPEYAAVPTLKAHEDTTVVGQEAENIMLGWKFGKASSLQADTLDVVNSILNNGKAGLLDADLNQPMRVQGTGSFIDGLHDYSTLIIEGMPKTGQNLDEVKSLILNEIAKLKKGEFDSNLLQAVIANKKRQYLENLSQNSNRVEQMKDAFIDGESWEQVVHRLSREEKMTKQQIINFANKYLDDNYVCVYKRQGNDTTIHKIDKPSITPIPTNNDKQSDFLKEVVNTKVTPIQPRFINFKTDLTKIDLNRHTHILYKQNTDNDLFQLDFDFPIGNEDNKKLEVAGSLLNYAGLKNMDATAIKKEFYNLAFDFNVNTSIKHTRFSLSGLNENMPKALRLFLELINNGKISKDDYEKVVSLILKNRDDNKKNQRENFYALEEYGEYGAFNPHRNIMSKEELQTANGNQLLAELHNLRQQCPMTVMYFGPSKEKEIISLVNKDYKAKNFTTANNLSDKKYTLGTTSANEVLIAPYDAKNIYMIQFHNENRDWSPANAPINALFNEYFGGGMNTVVFQELREARGLAYSADASYHSPSYKGEKEFFYTFIITQNDKMMDCINEFNKLLHSMPARQTSFDLAEQNLQKSLATNRTTDFYILDAYMKAQDRGIDYDINKKIYENIPSLKLKDLVDFAQNRIANKPYKYIILGDEKSLDMKSLEKIAPIKRLTSEDIFGY